MPAKSGKQNMQAFGRLKGAGPSPEVAKEFTTPPKKKLMMGGKSKPKGLFR